MSQLSKWSRTAVAVTAMCLMALLSGVGCATVIDGQPQSILSNRLDELHQRVDAANTPDAKYKAYWSEVCDTTRELEASRPADGKWSVDELAAAYNRAVYDYYEQLVDFDHMGQNSQLPQDAVARDFGRFAAGREVCDYMS